MQEITITQSLTAFDVYKASIISALGNKRLKVILYLVPSIVVITSLPSIILSTGNERWKGILSMLMGLAFLVVFFYGITFILSLLLVKFKSDLFKNISYSFNNWGMIRKGKSTELQRPWDKFIKWKETNSFIFLFITENDPHVILKKNLTADELVIVKGIIESHLGLFPSKK